MRDCIKGESMLVAKQAPSVTEQPIRTFMIRSFLFCLWHPNNPTSTPLPSQPCWTTCSFQTWTLPCLIALLSAFLSLCIFSLFPASLFLLFSSPILLWGEFDDPLWPSSQLAAPPSPTASGTLNQSASQSNVSSPAINSHVNKQVPPGHTWIFVPPPP